MLLRSTHLCAVALMCSIALPAIVHAEDMTNKCEALAGLKLYSTRIDAATMQGKGILPPDPNSAMTGSAAREIAIDNHCLIAGKIEDRKGVGGQYGIRFQMRAPTEWNGRFLFQGGGGMDGFIAPAIGSIPVFSSTADPALTRGYAVISMDGGHNGHDASFAQDQQSRLDLAYASIGKVTRVAKELIAAFYGRAPEHSVFMGCSNGGREAMMAAQRFPLEFDGVVVGNPGFHLSAAALAQAWDVQKLMAIAPVVNGEPILAQALTQDDLDLVSSAVLEACDELDGVKDGLINAYRSCKFDPESLRGKLSDEKLNALETIMDGPVGADGKALYSDWPYDVGMNAMGWRVWKLGTSGTGQSDALSVTLGSDSLPHLFMTPPHKEFDATTLDFDVVAKDIAQMGALNDATSTFMTTFAERGGKMVIFHGMSDPVFSANDLMRWYEQVGKDTGDDVARLFMVPGMNHCGGGPALDDFDPLTLLEKWMDKGEVPTEMPAKGVAFPGVSQPICAYPKEAYYNGGDPASLGSYSCK